ncbi:TRAP transporter, 4TM/12TM fusion protein [uncultured delta proteobacterium]|uniref:TRAP transporter, 4TM/12TM fusion protein n=1 Tax=uncultured delta proteobacterium TaxID=34034 RepID=A0A212JB29_9DELT|nr:TRAP transporter, 4TM/12TM fusion protein [uncultured delta proteobacterium]
MTEEDKSQEIATLKEMGVSALGTEDADEILRKFDAEARVRKLDGFASKILTGVAVLMSVFHLYMAGLGTMPTNKQRMLHLAFTLVIIFLSYPFSKKGSKKGASIIDFMLAAVGLIVNLYIFFAIDDISAKAGLVTQTDIILGTITIVIVLEAARRCVGYELPLLAIAFLAYAYLGPYLPGDLMHRGYSFERLVDHMFISAEGIYGIALGVSSTFIFLFILFGAFLGATGLSELFTNASLAIAGHKPGGPAKVAIIASGLLGMINGSAAANVVTTGAFTIPLMKHVGYQAHFAGAVEAVASTGGQIMPPVMGAAAFIMAEFLGIPYKTVMITALIPAILYYLAVWINVDLEARKLGLKGLPKDQLPDAKAELKKSGHLLLPIVLLMYLLLADYTPAYSAFYSILALVAVSFFKKHTRMNLKSLIISLDSGARQAVGVAVACAVVGIIVGVVSITGLGLQLANMILMLSGGLLIPTLFLTMVACMIMGMGMPTSAAYIVAGTVAAPAMVNLGVDPIVAHMFVLYYAVLSAITPPVALAAYAGAGIANAPPSKVGWTAVRLGLAGFIVPFMFVFSPALCAQSDSLLIIFRCLATATIGIYCLACSIQGYMLKNTDYLERALLFASALLLIDGGVITDAAGFGLLAIVWVKQKASSKKAAALQTAATE